MHGRERNFGDKGGEKRGDRKRGVMHGREKIYIESLQGWGRGVERGERVAMHGRESIRESLHRLK